MPTNAVTDADFQTQVLESDVPVLVDFWASWCGPCKMVAPVLEELSEEFGGKVRILKMDIDENPDSPARAGVRSIPTMMLFKDGKAVATKVGAAPKGAIRDFVESNA